MPPMENRDIFGVATFICYRRPLLPLLPVFKENGLINLELWGIPKGHPEHFPYKNSQFLKKFKKALQENQINPYSIHSPISSYWSISSLEEELREKALKEIKICIEAASFLGSRIVVIHPGTRNRGSKDNLLSSLESLLKFAESYEITLSIENMPPGILGSKMEELTWMREHLPDSVGFTLDTGHAFMNGNLEEIISLLSTRINHLHIQDTFPGRDEHLIPGEGKIEWDKLFSSLRETGYRGGWILEVREKFNIPFPRLLTNLREVIEKLKGL